MYECYMPILTLCLYNHFVSTIKLLLKQIDNDAMFQIENISKSEFKLFIHFAYIRIQILW